MKCILHSSTDMSNTVEQIKFSCNEYTNFFLSGLVLCWVDCVEYMYMYQTGGNVWHTNGTLAISSFSFLLNLELTRYVVEGKLDSFRISFNLDVKSCFE